MKVEIWSDVVCPFCYIGKRKFEEALNGFPGKNTVKVEWRSFQLDPDAQSEPGKSLAASLSEKKGWSMEQTRGMMQHVTEAAAAVGLQFRMDQAVVANTFDAHRFLHLAATRGLQNEAEEQLFAAYFVLGKNVADKETLRQIGQSLGLPADEVDQVLQSDDYRKAVEADQRRAAEVGARGVPFFVFNDKYAVSGAQSPELFRQVLEKVMEEEQALPELVDGSSCSPDGYCS